MFVLEWPFGLGGRKVGSFGCWCSEENPKMLAMQKLVKEMLTKKIIRIRIPPEKTKTKKTNLPKISCC